jgi:lipopolysaccharide/colanic/teichoic acid biosynthesis glycosyltransferase
MDQQVMKTAESGVSIISPKAAASPEVEVWKRIIDLTCILLALPVLVPFSFLLAVLIKLVSPGPVLFKAERIGFRGRPFNCLKFRTMKVNAETAGHQNYTGHLIKNPNIPMVKLDSAGDTRLIPFGRLIRATGLDELPQLLNVWRGEMSLVGPRPCLPYEFKAFLPWHRKRCETLPGLTGLWQVSGKNNTTFERMMELDIWYARNKSVWLDLYIIVKTVPALVIQVLETRRRAAGLIPATSTAAVPQSGAQ